MHGNSEALDTQDLTTITLTNPPYRHFQLT